MEVSDEFNATAGNLTPIVQSVAQSLYWQSCPGSFSFTVHNSQP